jgi:hypothetical protein
MSYDFRSDEYTTDALYAAMTGEASSGDYDPEVAMEATEEALLDFEDKVADETSKIVGDDKGPISKEEIITELRKHNVPENFLKIFKESSVKAYLQLVIDKIIEFLGGIGFFAGMPSEQANKIKQSIKDATYKDAKTYIEEKRKKIYKRKIRKKKLATKKDYESIGFDDKYGLDEFPARFEKGFLDQFSQGLFQVESNNTAWGEWIENVSEKAGAIGPSQIMFFNFPKWMKDAGYNWDKYYDKMTQDQKKFWDKYKNSRKGTYTSKPDNEVPNTENDPTYQTVGSIMAAILRDVGATDGQILKDMTFKKLEEYFEDTEDWGVVAGSWYCGPGYKGSPERNECKEYAEKVLSNFKRNLGKSASKISIFKKISDFSNKLDENRLYKEASIIDNGLFKFSS